MNRSPLAACSPSNVRMSPRVTSGSRRNLHSRSGREPRKTLRLQPWQKLERLHSLRPSLLQGCKRRRCVICRCRSRGCCAIGARRFNCPPYHPLSGPLGRLRTRFTASISRPLLQQWSATSSTEVSAFSNRSTSSEISSKVNRPVFGRSYQTTYRAFICATRHGAQLAQHRSAGEGRHAVVCSSWCGSETRQFPIAQHNGFA